MNTRIYLMGSRVFAFLIVTLSVGVAPCLAGSANWSTTNIQYLYGTNYELGDDTRSIVTLEHVNGWKYGDNFFFVDITNPNRTGVATKTDLYGEISPRFSLSALSDSDLSVGMIKDFLITTTLEEGNGFHNYLYGIAADFNIPGFKVFQFNYYFVRDEVTADDKGSQITLVWLAPFDLGKTTLTLEGFLDYAYGLDKSEDNIIAGPRFLVDVGQFMGAPGNVQAGIEYQIWRNKFGIKDVDENVAQLMVKWIW